MLKSFSKLLQGTQAGRARVCKSSSTVTVPVLLPSLEDFPLLGFVQFVKLVCLCYNGHLRAMIPRQSSETLALTEDDGDLIPRSPMVASTTVF